MLCHPLLLLQLAQLGRLCTANQAHMGRDVETMGALLGKAFLLRRSVSFEDIPMEAPSATVTPSSHAQAPPGGPFQPSAPKPIPFQTTPPPPPPPLEGGVYYLPQVENPEWPPAPTSSTLGQPPLLFVPPPLPAPRPPSPPSPPPTPPPPPSPAPRPPPSQAAAGADDAWTTITPSMAAYSGRRARLPEAEARAKKTEASISAKKASKLSKASIRPTYKYHDVLRREFAARES